MAFKACPLQQLNLPVHNRALIPDGLLDGCCGAHQWACMQLERPVTRHSSLQVFMRPMPCRCGSRTWGPAMRRPTTCATSSTRHHSRCPVMQPAGAFTIGLAQPSLFKGDCMNRRIITCRSHHVHRFLHAFQRARLALLVYPILCAWPLYAALRRRSDHPSIHPFMYIHVSILVTV
jgi:hypothetical protein